MLSPVKIWRNQKSIAGLVGKTGTLVAWTVIRVPPAHYSAQAPYPVVLVRLGDGHLVTCQFVDWNEQHLIVDQPVRLVVRKVVEPTEDGIIPYGIKAKPL
jgi:uncharacterized OB-fold protein